MKTKFEVKKLIEDNLADVFSYLEDLLKNQQTSNFVNTLVILKSSYKETQQLNNLGAMDYDDFSRKITQIKLNILNLIDDIPNQYFESKLVKSSPQATKLQTSIDTNYTFLTISKLIRELVDISAEFKLNTNESLIRLNLNNKRTVLVNQVSKLIHIHNFSLSGIEYQLIADAFYEISDYDKATEFYKKAIESIDEYTVSAVSKIISIRGYANFLFKINEVEKGKKQYQTAILEVDSAQANLQNGKTYQMQFINQIEHRMVEAAIESYKIAKNYYSKIENPTTRNLLIRDLKTIWLNSHALAGNQIPE